MVATSAMICKKGFAPHTGARAIPPTLLDTWLTHDCEFPETLCIEQGVGAFLQVCRVEGSMDFSCALDGSRESVKCQVTSAE